MEPSTREDAFAILRRIGAPPRLQRHAELVCEAADALVEGFAALKIPLRDDFVRVGAILHDAGKSVHPGELDRPGALHEPDGERLLLQHGVSADVARVCRSHAQWRELDVDLDELVIALADKLWKGARVADLEELVIAMAAIASGQDRWQLFAALDSLFEGIAADADARLARSVP